MSKNYMQEARSQKAKADLNASEAFESAQRKIKTLETKLNLLKEKIKEPDLIREAFKELQAELEEIRLKELKKINMLGQRSVISTLIDEMQSKIDSVAVEKGISKSIGESYLSNSVVHKVSKKKNKIKLPKKKKQIIDKIGIKSLEKLLSELELINDSQEEKEYKTLEFIPPDIDYYAVFYDTKSNKSVSIDTGYIRYISKNKKDNKLFFVRKGKKSEIKVSSQELKDFDRIFNNRAHDKVQLSLESLENIQQAIKHSSSAKLLKSYYRSTYQDNPEKIALEEQYRKVKAFYLQPQSGNKKTNTHLKKKLNDQGEEKKSTNEAFVTDAINKPVKKWKRQDITNWAKEIKGKLTEDSVFKTIAVLDRANELATGSNKLRDTQILSILTFLKSSGLQGKLCQIITGEGKTTIVSMIAVIRVLQGQKVDVITSNPVLAEDGVKDRETFYQILNINAAHNNYNSGYTKGKKECYGADIVYGSIGNFQGDYLRHEFEGLNTRGERKCEDVILDEVDSMVIDNGRHITKLSELFPGMESFRYIYIKIWQALLQAENEFIKDLLLEDQEPGRKASEAKITVKEKIKKRKLLEDPEIIKLIPEHLREYANNTLEEWIEQAWSAKYEFKENEQYILKQKKGELSIIPVDNQNTGITLKNTIWSKGLHQFLQIKHNLHLTTESLTSCYISNLGYIKKYKKIFGLTGTLGSVAEQNLIKAVYSVNYAKIPTYKEKKFKEYDGVVTGDIEWVSKVTNESIDIVRDYNRAVLIICNTIKDVVETVENLKEIKYTNDINFKIKTYADEDGSHVTNDIVEVGDIIIATNIAGRGTDLKTSRELEHNGGLHVIIGFLPCNQRVEDQAKGRTSRQGNEGTAQLVIRDSEVKDLGVENIERVDFKQLKYLRDVLEKERLQDVQRNGIREVEFQDKLFEKFCDLYKRLLKAAKNPKNEDKAKSRMFLKDLKEFWAFWLERQKVSYKNLPKNTEELSNKIETDFESFQKEADEIVKKDKFSNPYYCVMLAELYLRDNEIDKAEEMLKPSISDNPSILYPAYVKSFEIAMEQGGQLIKRFIEALQKTFYDYNGTAMEQGGQLIKRIKMFIEEENFDYDVLINSDDKKHEIQNIKDQIINSLSNRKYDLEYKKHAIEYLDKAEQSIKTEINFLENLLKSKELNDILIVYDYNKYNSLTHISGHYDNKLALDYWYDDDDIEYIGKSLLHQQKNTDGSFIDIDKQFKSRLTLDSITTLFENDRNNNNSDFQEAKPVFICYNIGGSNDKEGGVHWVAMCAVRQGKKLTILYKDSYGDLSKNAGVVEQEFRKQSIEGCPERYEELEFIKHDEKDQEDGSACGPMALKNLEKMAQHISNHGINKFIKDFNQIAFCKQEDVQKLRHDFVRILNDAFELKEQLIPPAIHISSNKRFTAEELTELNNNLFLKHLNSRYICLNFYLQNILNLKEVLDNTKEKDLIISSRVLGYLKQLGNEEQEKVLKDSITNAEIDELDSISLGVIYNLKEVHEVPAEVTFNAQMQINGGIAALVIGISYPPALPLLGPVATALISEGMYDIALALIVEKDFDKREYIKDKLISYGITIFTLGVSAFTFFAKIFNKITKMYRGLVEALKKSHMITNIYSRLSTQIINIEKFLAGSLKSAKLVSNIKKYEVVFDIAKYTIKSAASSVGMSLFVEHVLTKNLDKLLQDLQTVLKAEIKKYLEDIKSNNCEIIQKLASKGVEEIIKKVIENNDDIKYIAKEITLGVLKNSKNTGLKVLSLAIENIISVIEVSNYAKNFCDKLIAELNNDPNNEEKSQDVIDAAEVIEKVSEQASKIQYGMVLSLLGKNIVSIPGVVINAVEQNKQKQERIKNNEKYFKDTASKLEVVDNECGQGALILIAQDKGKDIKNIDSFKKLQGFTEAKQISEVLKEIYGSNPLINQGQIASAKQVRAYMRKNKIEEGVVLLHKGNDQGHAVRVIKIEGCLYFQDPQNKDKPLIRGISKIDNYINKHGYNKLDIIGVKSPNGSRSLASRIKTFFIFGKDYQPIDADAKVQEINGKFGANIESYGTVGSHRILRDSEGIIPSGTKNPAHAIKDHVGVVPGKSTFKDKKQQNEIFAKARQSKYISTKDQKIEGNKIITTVELKIAFEGYNEKGNKQSFNNVKIVQYKESDGSLTVQTFYPFRNKRIETGPNSLQQGTSFNPVDTSVATIPTSFHEYTMEGIRKMLGLRTRVRASTDRISQAVILPGIYIFSKRYNNIQALLFELSLNSNSILPYRGRNNETSKDTSVFLAPISLHGNHAVGVIFVVQDDGNRYKAFYLDPENNIIPEDLAKIFKENGYEIEQLPTEGQRYTNCGPEVIENFMLYLTGERLSQEDAIVNNSRLMEQELLSLGYAAETSSLVTKDDYIKYETPTIVSNAALHSTQVSSGGTVGQHTVNSIIVPQGMIDTVIATVQLVTVFDDILMESFSDSINQDSATGVLGAFYLADY